MAGAGLLVARGLDADSEWTALLPGMLLMGAGIGLVNPTVSEAAIGVVPAAKAATGAAINNTFRQVGVAVGIAALGAVFQGRVESKLGDLLASGPPALQGQAGELAPAVSSGTPRRRSRRHRPRRRRSWPMRPRGVPLRTERDLPDCRSHGLVGATLSLLLIRARDLHLDAHEESTISPEPAAGDEQPALAA